MVIVLAKLGSPEHLGQFAFGLAMTAPVFMFSTLRLRDVQATDAKNEYRFGDYFALRIMTTTFRAGDPARGHPPRAHRGEVRQHLE